MDQSLNVSARDPHWRTRQSAQRAEQRARAAKNLHKFIVAEREAKRFRLAHRTQMVGSFPNPSDPDQKCNPTDARAGFPLGIHYLRGDITEAEYDAGLHYVRLHYAIFGASSTHSALAAITPPGGGDEADLTQRVPLTDMTRERIMADAEIDLGEATATLLTLPTLHPYSILCNRALYDLPARFMDPARRRSEEDSDADARDIVALREALDTLVELWHRRHDAR